ncbi:MAG: DUF4251 domain-containing protein, partial [Deltaproteobacteria bacterium]|nr:DUF4251 domain-containing protein [Deltaproteobacteria bacterium]
MKRATIYLLTIVLMLGIAFPVFSQSGKASKEDRKEQKEYEKEKRKEETEKEKAMKAELTKMMVNYQRFVLEADQLSDKYGQRVQVSPNINFIMIDSLEGTIQLGSAFNLGYNGVGGTTVDGRITKYIVNKTGRKKDAYSIQLIFMSAIGTYDISLLVGSEGHASATIRGNWSGQLSYHGQLIPLG